MKKLIVNADDFGFAHDVNAGIVEAHGKGILTATTLMANGSAFDDAVSLAREHPTLDVGVHLVLVGGSSLRTGLPLPQGVHELLHAMVRGRIRPYDELKPQVDRVLGAGLRPTHLDTHKHTHLIPSVLNAVARLSHEYGIRWVRQPLMHGLLLPLHSALQRRDCRVTDHFAGFQMTGRFRVEELVALIRSLPEGITEFMCHPGRCTSELRSRHTRLKESREAELNALIAPEVRRAIEEQGVQLTRYRDL